MTAKFFSYANLMAWLIAEQSLPILFRIAKMNINMYNTPNIIELEGRGRQINKVKSQSHFTGAAAHC